MKTFLTLLLSCFALSIFAAEPGGDPSGTWKWKASVMGRELENTLKLELKNGTLSGTIDNRAGKASIQNPSFTGRDISFSVERELRKRKLVTRYQGRLEGDAINGTITMTGGRGDEPVTGEWHATRS